MCDIVSRTGQLCGQCQNRTSTPVYSYYPQCVHCPEGTNNWPKYLAVSLLPITLFFLVAVALRFRATSPHLAGYIMFCQLVTSPPILRRVTISNSRHPSLHKVGDVVSKVIISLLSIWNLDFFQTVYSSFCLQPGASTFQILSFHYLIAVYPLGLIVLTYILVTLHYYDNGLVVWIWRPFCKCFVRFRRKWDIENDAFVTFLLLSYVICNVLRQWKTSLIPTYRVYRLYDIYNYIFQTVRRARAGNAQRANVAPAVEVQWSI